jgi:hypothetical protein
MAKDANPKTEPEKPGAHPTAGSKQPGIDPSAPASGTAGWGTTRDEREVLSPPDPAATRAGQMKGNPGDSMTEASSRASEAATTNKRPEDSSRE